MKVTRRSIFIIIVLLGLTVLALLWTNRRAHQAPGMRVFHIAPLDVESVADEVALVEELIPKTTGSESDPHAKRILAMGKAAAPDLVALLADETDSKVFYGRQYAKGDVAFALLEDLYFECKAGPTGENWDVAIQRLTRGDYWGFVGAPGGRAGLQSLCREMIAQQSGGGR